MTNNCWPITVYSLSGDEILIHKPCLWQGGPVLLKSYFLGKQEGILNLSFFSGSLFHLEAFVHGDAFQIKAYA